MFTRTSSRGFALLIAVPFFIGICFADSPITAATISVPQDQPTIQAGINAAQNGDVVLVSPGTYFERLTIASKTITVASHFLTTGDQQFINSTVIDSNGGTVITVRSSVGPETKIIGFTIRDGSTDGIAASGKLHILNNHFINNGDAIDYSSSGGFCRNNIFENNSDDAIDLDSATGAVIENNIIRNNGDDGIEVRLHPYVGPTLSIIIRGNTIFGNDEDGIQLIDYPEISNRFFLIERNLIYNNAMVGLGLMDDGVTVEDFRAASIPEPIDLVNNTFSGNPYAVTGGDNLIAVNNLFINSSILGIKNIDGASVVVNSLFWNNKAEEVGSNLDLFATKYEDPRLTADFKPQPGSPAIDAGTPFFFIWERGVVLRLDPSEYSGIAPDLGKFEYSPTVKDDSRRLTDRYFSTYGKFLF